MATMQGSPLAREERLDVVDALRGFALFGILLANILYWSGWGMVTDEQRIAWGGASGDLWQYRFHHLFVDGKFYTIFSFLFGAGFALQLERLLRRGQDGLRIYRRRALVLLAIGVVHNFLIWDGDILLLYALLGLLLPLFHRWSSRALVWTGLVLVFVVPFAGIALFDALGWKPQDVFYSLSNDIAQAQGVNTAPEQILAWMQREDWRGWFAWISSGPAYSLGLRLETWRIPKVLGIMLIGMAAGRGLTDGSLLANRALLQRVAIGGLLIGVPASLAYAFRPGQGQADWPALIGTMPLGMAYAAAFALAWPWASRWLGVFSAPGRMALTNYLTQSVLGVVLFYGVGFGLVGRLPIWGFYGYAVLLFVAQVVFSRWWLARHEQGPMEALWRRWTYGKQPA
ncbi:DUF418 domain-containing protein [Arenimonas oryziterrae]|uniref:DUF418 domain-containing protein n=1 Tax=Arenimonas oryziterrae DSM 21050 = YC6267 TaxID=1121015 RepID=A0A091BH52_9GAMM|nr:DUF418 domain-containing protein [Arenimonas oryziterrae]KFN43695.1 hypothetical protein N789_10485 [Arenimonas oryziterrae DSM 21050 = YC6267]